MSIELLNKFLKESDDLFHAEIKTDENSDYRRGYYAGRLHAAIALKELYMRDKLSLPFTSIDFGMSNE